jgi:thiamine biosynthesis lipoprotein
MSLAVQPAAALALVADPCEVADRSRAFRAMASDITVWNESAAARPEDAVEKVAEVFAQVEKECTRFSPDSDLMRANAAGDSWCIVGQYCFEAIAEAARAHLRTGGIFDPRILRSLIGLGYDRTLAFGPGVTDIKAVTRDRPGPARARWEPGLDPERSAVRIGPDPIDLGGIGKGLAVRWAARRIAPEFPVFYIEAGGDGYFAGHGPAGLGWQVGVEDPEGGATPLAVLTVADAACATSSTRVRSWTVGGRPVHHLIDPRTGEPGRGALRSVSVVHQDPATAEIWSKVLFLHGRSEIAGAAAVEDLAAIWVDEQGAVDVSPAAERFVTWRAR